jgi:hypothetical protein
MALIIREARPVATSPAGRARAARQIGAFSVGGALKSVGGALKSAATTTAQGAVQGAGQSLANTLRNALAPGSAAPRPRAPAGVPANYWPWIAGGAGALVVGYLVLRRRPASA